MSNNEVIELAYWNKVFSDDYLEFLKKKDEDRVELKTNRINWYCGLKDYRVLLARLNGEIVAQSSAYKATAVIHNEELDWWWSVDTFALASSRGKGIGKRLQLQLHQDCINFSSQWYSRINGIIKHKCGTAELFRTKFSYYPVGHYCSKLASMFAKKICKRNREIPFTTSWKYLSINSLLSRRFDVHEIDLASLINDYHKDIELSLTQYDFYIKRTKSYLEWKYLNNPSIQCHSLVINNETTNKVLATVIFSDVQTTELYTIPSRIVKVLDCFIFDPKSINIKEVLVVVAKFFKGNNIPIDGLCCLQDCSYWPKFAYPIKGSAMLSTYKPSKPIKNPYVSYSDQDMEQ